MAALFIQSTCFSSFTVEKKDLSWTQIMTTFFPFSPEDSNDRILGFLQKQNEALKVECWRVVSKTVDGQGVQLVLFVD